MSEYTEFIDGIPVHPIASLFPMIGDDELQALADDIKAHGQREPIIVAYLDEAMLHEPVVIDGRNRFAACELAGVEPEFKYVMSLNDRELSPQVIADWIISHNLHRRHMSKSQMATVAVEYEKWLAVEAEKRMTAGLKQHSNPEENFPQGERAPQASDEAGAMLGVSGRTVRDAKYVANNDAELFEKMRRNEITASAAAKRIRESLKPKVELTPDHSATYKPDPASPKPRRGPLTDTALNAALKVAKAAESWGRIIADDRFKKNRETIRDINLSRLRQARKDLDAAIAALEGAGGGKVGSITEREHLDSLERDRNRLKGFLIGYGQAWGMRNHPYRDQVLELLDEFERPRFLEIEKEITWPPTKK